MIVGPDRQKFQAWHPTMLVAKGKPKGQDFGFHVVELIVLVEFSEPLVATRLEITDVSDRGASAQFIEAEIARNRLDEPAAPERGEDERRKPCAVGACHLRRIEHTRIGITE
jgi:hypothetical protein